MLSAGGAASKTDIISAIRYYVDKIASDSTIGGMKALILDPTTTQIVSMVYSQTQILEQEVYLVEVLGKRHEPMLHLKAAVFIQPTEANIQLLIKELKDPKFAEYHLFFSNILPPDMLTRLGRADEFEVVRQVQEYYADFMAINEDFFQLGIYDSLLASKTPRTMESGVVLEKNVSGVLSVLLALKRRPSQVRYQAASDLARRVATDVLDKIERDDVFDFRRQEGPLLIILDRRDDPITPLLTQWTYQAMVHELLELSCNRVSLKHAPGIKKDLEEVVLSPTQDDFFAANRYSNFGDLGNSVKALLDDYQRRSSQNKVENITSIEDMQNFMDRFPAFRSHSINVSKHVAIIGELSRLVDKFRLLEISELEQEIACANEHGTHKRELLEKLSNPKVQAADKLRLALLYIIRYESYDEIGQIRAKLDNPQDAATLDAMLEYAGDAKRAPGLFSSSNLINKLFKTVTSGVGGVENVYTQHQPLLSSVLDAISKGKLKDSVYPPVSSGGGGSSRPSEVIAFIVGGATYEEAQKVAQFNTETPGIKVILGGSCIHNSTSFLAEVNKMFGSGY